MVLLAVASGQERGSEMAYGLAGHWEGANSDVFFFFSFSVCAYFFIYNYFILAYPERGDSDLAACVGWLTLPPPLPALVGARK